MEEFIGVVEGYARIVMVDSDGEINLRLPSPSYILHAAADGGN